MKDEDFELTEEQQRELLWRMMNEKSPMKRWCEEHPEDCKPHSFADRVAGWPEAVKRTSESLKKFIELQKKRSQEDHERYLEWRKQQQQNQEPPQPEKS